MNAYEYSQISRKQAKARDAEIKQGLTTICSVYVPEWECYAMLDLSGAVHTHENSFDCYDNAQSANETIAKHQRSQ